MELSDWKVKEYKMFNGLVLLKPDFYPEDILAYSKKAIIICDGSSVINYRGYVFSDTQELVKKYGEKYCPNIRLGTLNKRKNGSLRG